MKKEDNNMDIFTKGYIEKDKNNEEEVINPEEELEATQIKIASLPIVEEAKEESKKVVKVNKKKKTKSKKNLILIVGIIIELIIIAIIILLSIKPKSYETVVTCKNEQNLDDYRLITNNTYYFNKQNIVIKSDIETDYIFNTKEKYEEYKQVYVSTDINNFSGLTQKSAFDDVNYIYQNKTSYDYNKLKKNKKVKVENDKLTLNISNKDDVTIYIQDYESVLESNEEMGFICE